MSDFAPVPVRIGRPLYPKRTSSLPLLPITKKYKKVVTIAISGCSSSGKSTLTILLTEIFSTVQNSVTPAILLNNSSVKLGLQASDFAVCSENDADLINDGGKDDDEEIATVRKRIPIVIHQDAYFADKSYCPIVSFTSTPADADFTKRSLSDDLIRQYTISWSGSNTIGRATHSSNSHNYTSNVEEQVSSFWYINGPDTDCWDSLDIPALADALQHIRETGEMSDTAEQLEKFTADYHPGLLVTEAHRDAIVYVYADLIKEMKEVVKAWTETQTVAHSESRFEGQSTSGVIVPDNKKTVNPPALCLIDGFLLFPSPQSTHPNSNQHASQNFENRVSTSNFMVPNSSPRLKREDPDVLVARARKAAFQIRNASARAKLMESLDIKLFLPTSKAEAKKRRFVRDTYTDSPPGKRYPGQMWKCEGYFEKVVWGNYVKEHEWLFEHNLADHTGDDEYTGDEQHDGTAQHAGGVDLTGATDQGSVAMGGDGKKCVASAEAKKRGVHIRPELDAGVQETVSWAVQVILQELESKKCLTSYTPDLQQTSAASHHDAEDEHSEIMYDGKKGKTSLRKEIGGWKGCFCF